MKKGLKVFISIIFLLITLIIVIPLIFEGKIIELVKKNINENVNASFNFEDANLSLWSSFPNTKASLKNITLINNAPFKGDTLISAKEISLRFPLKELFNNSSKSINISNFTIDEANINLKIDEKGNANYDIEKEKSDASKPDDEESNTFQLGLESYQILNSKISYHDESGKIDFKLDDLNHSGTGNLSLEKTELKTKTSTLISLAMDSITYLSKNNIQLDAVLEMNFEDNKYSFLDNNLLINKLPLIFDGYVKLNDNNQDIDISFKTPSSDFKNFLALIPEVYSKDIENVSTTGNFEVNGKFEGIVDEVHIPKFHITINSDDASFKYPDLPETLKNINIKTEITNETGLSKDTYVIIDKLSFQINDDAFSANAKLMEITENMKVNAKLKGIINLENLEKVSPAESVKDLKGIVNMDVKTSFDMHSIEKEQYQNTKTLGFIKVTDFEFNSTELSNPLKIEKTEVTLNPETVILNSFDAQLGKTDLKASGSINNLLGFLFNDGNIEGKFITSSNTFSVDDFMVSEVENETEDKNGTKSEEQIKIPSFLNCTIDANANTVLYDNISLKNVSGTLIIKDQKAELKNMKSNVFDGTLGFNGIVSTKEGEIPSFQMNLGIDNFNISQSFKTLDLLNALAPIADAVKGKLNSIISLSGNLNNDFTPNLNSLSGSFLGELHSSTVSTKNAPLLQSLEQNMSFLDLQKLDLDDIKVFSDFKDGRITLKPITLKYEDIEIDISGSHGFDNSLNYDAIFHVPAKYLGKEASQMLTKLNNEELNTINVPLSVLITGKFSDPNVKTDFKSAISNLSNQVADSQKDRLIEKGKDKVTNLLDDILKDDKKQKDSTATTKSTDKDALKDAANDILGNFLGKKKDTTN